MCGALDKDQPYTKISIRQAMKVLIVFWDTVTQKMFMNCFKKAGITSEAQRAALASSNSLFKDFQESLDALKAADSDMAPEGLPLKTF